VTGSRSERLPGRSVRLRPLEVPDSWPAAAVLAALGLLLVAGGGPLRPALATFALGVTGVLAALWLRGALARRRAEAAHDAVVAETAARLQGAVDHPLASALAALVGRTDDPPRSVAAVAREVAAAARSDDVPVIVSVGADATVAGIDQALHLLVRRAAATGSSVAVGVAGGRVEIRPAGAGDPYAVDLARALARRAGGDVHELGTLTVLELPPATFARQCAPN
jgi:hypothetical protein